jgi:hypothetical protein
VRQHQQGVWERPAPGGTTLPHKSLQTAPTARCACDCCLCVALSTQRAQHTFHMDSVNFSTALRLRSAVTLMLLCSHTGCKQRHARGCQRTHGSDRRPSVCCYGVVRLSDRGQAALLVGHMCLCWNCVQVLRCGDLTSYTRLLRTHLKMGKNTLMPAAGTIQSVSTNIAGQRGGYWSTVELATRTSEAHNPCYVSRHCVAASSADSRFAAVACKVLLLLKAEVAACARQISVCVSVSAVARFVSCECLSRGSW